MFQRPFWISLILTIPVLIYSELFQQLLGYTAPAFPGSAYVDKVQNLAWAVGYNAIALPLAAGVLAGIGFVLPAWVGAVLMSLSTIIVAINAQTLRGLNLQDTSTPTVAATPRTA